MLWSRNRKEVEPQKRAGELKRELDAHAQGSKVGKKELRMSRGLGPRGGNAGCLLATSLLNNNAAD